MVNKFYVFLFIVLIGIFIGIFYITQKDSLLKGFTVQSPTPIFPLDSNTLRVISPSPQKGQEVVNETQTVQNVQPTFGVEAGMKASYSAVIKTGKGDIEITLFGTSAPRTVKNFMEKAKKGVYKNLTFHRVEDWVIQGGDPKGDSLGGGLMQTELNSHPFVIGSLGAARGGDIRVSNDSQFFITKTEATWLNEQYTNFGVVTKGMDVVGKIEIGDKILGVEVKE